MKRLAIIIAVLTVLLGTTAAFAENEAKKAFYGTVSELAEANKKLAALENELEYYTNQINEIKKSGSSSQIRSPEMNRLQAQSKEISDRLTLLQRRALKLREDAKKAALSYMEAIDAKITQNPKGKSIPKLIKERNVAKNWLAANDRAEGRGFLPNVASDIEDVQTLREKSDILKDREDQVREHIAQIQKRISELETRRKLWSERNLFMREESLFDENVYFARPQAPASSETGKVEPTAVVSRETESAKTSTGGSTPTPQSDAPSAPPGESAPQMVVRGYSPASAEGGVEVSGRSPEAVSSAEVATQTSTPSESGGRGEPEAISQPMNFDQHHDLPASTLYTSADLGYLKSELKRWEEVAKALEKNQEIIGDKIKKLKGQDRR